MNFSNNRKLSGLAEQLQYLSWVAATVATLGSLYFSEISGYIPCTYCWYQRILMYPLVIILGIGAVRKDRTAALYALPLSGIGILMSTFHYLTQKTSWFNSASEACGQIPCGLEYINWAGFITIPFLALIAFVLIFVFQWIVWRSGK